MEEIFALEEKRKKDDSFNHVASFVAPDITDSLIEQYFVNR